MFRLSAQLIRREIDTRLLALRYLLQ